MNRSVVIVGGETAALQRVVPILRRSDFSVEYWEQASIAADMLAERTVDLVIARYPMAGLSLEDLIARIRATDAASRNASLMLLADPEDAGEVAGFLERGVNRVVSLDAPSDRLLHAVADLVAVTPRQELRILVELSLSIHGSRERMLTMSRNMSTSGMLVRGGRELAVGTRIRFELSLGEFSPPIRGDAEVVRHTADHERLEGIGLRFLEFDGDGQQRLERYLESG